MTKPMLRRLQRIETCRYRSPRVAAILKRIRVFPDKNTDQVLLCMTEGRWEEVPALFDIRTLNDDELSAYIGVYQRYLNAQDRKMTSKPRRTI